jgi:hypothetical protein
VYGSFHFAFQAVNLRNMSNMSLTTLVTVYALEVKVEVLTFNHGCQILALEWCTGPHTIGVFGAATPILLDVLEL